MERAIKLVFQRLLGGKWSVGWLSTGRRAACLRPIKCEMMSVRLTLWYDGGCEIEGGRQ